MFKNVRSNKVQRTAAAAAISVFALYGPLGCKSNETKQTPVTLSSAQATPNIQPQASEPAKVQDKKAEEKKPEQEKTVVLEQRCESAEFEPSKGAFKNMAYVRIDNENGFWIDRYENHLVDARSKKPYPWNEQPPYGIPTLVPVSEPCLFPQTRVSYSMAEEGCSKIGKRLCTPAEFIIACMGPDLQETNGKCNEGKINPHIMKLLFPGIRARDWNGKMFNDPRIGLIGNGINTSDIRQYATAEEWITAGKPLSEKPSDLPIDLRYLTRTAEYSKCRNNLDIFDMRGNLSEWVAIKPEENDVADAGTNDAGEKMAEFARASATLAGSGYSSDLEKRASCHVVEGTFSIHASLYISGFRCCKGPKTWEVRGR